MTTMVAEYAAGVDRQRLRSCFAASILLHIYAALAAIMLSKKTPDGLHTAQARELPLYIFLMLDCL